MSRLTSRMARIRKVLDELGDGDPEDIGLTEIERDLVLPRFQSFMVATELCFPFAEILTKCIETSNRFACSFERMKYLQCTNGHHEIGIYRDRYLDDYIQLRTQYRLTKDEKYIQELRQKILPTQQDHLFL